MLVQPYLSFDGRCEEAIEFYREALGVETTMLMRSKGIARITFYLDGRKLRTFTQSQASGEKFKLTIDVRKLRYGVHQVSFRVAMINRDCAATAAARMFFRPRPSLGTRFTG